MRGDPGIIEIDVIKLRSDEGIERDLTAKVVDDVLECEESGVRAERRRCALPPDMTLRRATTNQSRVSTKDRASVTASCATVATSSQGSLTPLNLRSRIAIMFPLQRESA